MNFSVFVCSFLIMYDTPLNPDFLVYSVILLGSRTLFTPHFKMGSSIASSNASGLKGLVSNLWLQVEWITIVAAVNSPGT